MAENTVRYWATSVLLSKTMWLNTVAFIVALLSLTEFVVLVPQRYMGIYGMVLAGLNLWLRTQTMRPVAFIGPKDTKPVEVPKVGPPPPGVTG